MSKIRINATHSFDVEIATQYGVDEAIVIGHFAHYIEHHAANDTNCFDGYYWTYDSAKSLAEKLPYWSSNKIQKLIKRMEEKELIVSGDFSADRFKRPKYYRLGDMFDQRVASYKAEPCQPNGLEGVSQMADSTVSQTAYSSLSDQSTIQSTDLKDTSENKFTDDDLTCANYIKDKIALTFPKAAAKANISKWADVVRLMRERDGLDHKRICQLIALVSKSDFWRKNIQSAATLRDKFERLEVELRAGSGDYRQIEVYDPNNQSRHQERVEQAKQAGWRTGYES